MNNIFCFSPKELATDAFLAWMFIELEINPILFPYLPKIFKALDLIDQEGVISNIKVTTQNKSIDLFLEFSYNGKDQSILFENKTWSSIHSDQLNRYKNTFPNCQKYKYLKLAFIDYQEMQDAKKSGYEIIDAFILEDALKEIYKLHPIIEHYYYFLNNVFINDLNWLKNNLYESKNQEILSKRDVQRKILSDLHEKIDGLNDDLWFKSGANNNGTPWTQLDFCSHKNAYGEEDEYVFWRIDKRDNKYYIRLNQYSYIDEKFSSQKKENLIKLRKIASDISNYLGLKQGKLSNRGLKESEIAIFFVEENPLSKFKNNLVEYTCQFHKAYENYKQG